MAGFTAKTGQRVGGVLAVVLALLSPSSLFATSLGYKNDTKAPIVVQISVLVNDKVQRGKPHTLFPGEMAWDNIAVPGQRQITIMDPKTNNKVIGQETIHVANKDVLLSVQWHAQPQIPGKAVVPPVIRLIPIAIVGPPGVVPPKNEPPKEAPKPGPNTPIPPRSTLPPSSGPAEHPKTPELPKSLPPTQDPKSTPRTDDPKSQPPSGGSTMPPSTDRPKSPPGEQPKASPPAEQPKSTPPAEKPKAPPQPPAGLPKSPLPKSPQPKSKGGN